MVHPASHRMSRVLWYSGSGLGNRHFRVREYHPLRSFFPERSTNDSSPYWPSTTPEEHVPPVWASPRSLAATWGISIDFFSSGYLDVSVLPVRLLYLCIQYKIPSLRWVGFPIRISLDHRLFTTFPKLFAGYHVLHRLWLPRHPPCTLIHLTI